MSNKYILKIPDITRNEENTTFKSETLFFTHRMGKKF